MIILEKTGSTVEELIRQYRKEHNIKDWELKYDIVSKPSAGFLGFIGKREAKVKFYLPEIEDRVRNFVETMLRKMGVGFSQIVSKTEGKTVYVEIKGCSDPGFLIGKNGTMLETLQFMVNRIYESDRKLDRVYLDSEGYRERREASFLKQFIPQFREVEKDGKPLTMEPMSSGDRRVIHRYIERSRGLKTLTVGEGDKKRVVVFSAKQSDKEVLAQSKHGKPANHKPLPHHKDPAKPQPQPKAQPPKAQATGETPAPKKNYRPPRRNYKKKAADV